MCVVCMCVCEYLCVCVYMYMHVCVCAVKSIYNMWLCEIWCVGV